MLQIIHDFAKGWISTTIAVILALAFIFWGVERYGSFSDNQHNIVATVNGQEITKNQFSILLQRAETQTPETANMKQSTENLKQSVLQQIIKTLALTQAAYKEGFRITDQQIQALLAVIPVFQQNGIFSKQKFEQVLQQMMYTEEDFLQQLRQDMLINQHQLGISTSAFVDPKELNQVLALLFEKRDFSYSIIPYESFISTKTITEKQIQDYYQTHIKAFTTPKKISIQYLQLSLPDIQAQQIINNDEVQRYYQDNIASYTKPQEWQIAHIFLNTKRDVKSSDSATFKKANDIINQLKSGKSFSDMVHAYSEDVLTIKKNGILPWLTAGMMDKNLESSIVKLKPGQIAGPIQTSNGIEIIKLISVKPPVTLAFEKVKEQVKKQLQYEQAEKAYADKLEQLGNLTYANPHSLQEAAEALGLHIQKTAFFNPTAIDNQFTNDPILANPKVLAIASSHDIMNGMNSDVINLDKQTAVVIRLLEQKPAEAKPLEAVKRDIIATVAKSEAMQKSYQIAQDIAARVTNGNSFEEELANKRFKSIHLSDVMRIKNSKNIPSDINSLAFSMPRPKDKNPSIKVAQLQNGNTVIIKLNSIINDQNTKENEKEKTELMKKLENTIAQAEIQESDQYILSKAKIKVNAFE